MTMILLSRFMGFSLYDHSVYKFQLNGSGSVQNYFVSDGMIQLRVERIAGWCSSEGFFDAQCHGLSVPGCAAEILCIRAGKDVLDE